MKQIKIRNHSSDVMPIVLEPWGEIFEVPAQSVIEIISDQENDEDSLEIDYEKAAIIVNAWSESMTVKINGETLKSD